MGSTVESRGEEAKCPAPGAPTASWIQSHVVRLVLFLKNRQPLSRETETPSPSSETQFSAVSKKPGLRIKLGARTLWIIPVRYARSVLMSNHGSGNKHLSWSSSENGGEDNVCVLSRGGAQPQDTGRRGRENEPGEEGKQV